MDLLILFFVFIYLSIATYTDVRTTIIPNFLSFFFISLGLFVHLLNFLNSGDSYILINSLIFSFIFFIIGAIMYYTRQWGGADSMLLITIGTLIPLYPNNIFEKIKNVSSGYFGVDFFINLLIVGAMYAIFYALFLIVKKRKEFFKEQKRFRNKKLEVSLFGSLLIINIAILLLNFNYLFLLVSLVVLVLYYITISLKLIEKLYFYKTIPSSKLIEGDYITEELKYKDKVIFKPIVHGVSKQQIKVIQKYFKEVPIKGGIAFAPVFLLATIITLLKGNLILYFI